MSNPRPSPQEVVQGALAAVALGVAFIAAGLGLDQLHLLGGITAIAAAFGSTATHT